MRRHALERIIHGAAITADHQREAHSPALIVEVNLLGLVHILDAARDAGVLRVLLIGSAAAYGRCLWREQPLDEHASGDPDTLFAISKAAPEQILWRLSDLYRLSVVVGRLATVFGLFEWPGGWRDHEPHPAGDRDRPDRQPRPAAAGGLARLVAGGGCLAASKGSFNRGVDGRPEVGERAQELPAFERYPPPA